MDCREFRRRLMIEPNRRDKQFLDHLNQCRECTREADRAWEFEKKLLAAFDAAPPGRLARAPTPPVNLRRLALAAGLSLALGLSVWTGRHSGLETELSVAILEHIKNEPNSLNEDRKLSAKAVEVMLSEIGARLTADLGPVRYLGYCHIHGQHGLHLVVPGKRGPVTVLLMPGEYVPERQILDSVNFSGAIVPTDYGSMAVVGGRREPLEASIEVLRNSVEWMPGGGAI